MVFSSPPPLINYVYATDKMFALSIKLHTVLDGYLSYSYDCMFVEQLVPTLKYENGMLKTYVLSVTNIIHIGIL